MKKSNDRTNQTREHRVYFKMRAPEAREVILCGSFNNWETSSRHLRKDKDGTWTGWLMLGQGAYEYRFLVDGVWRNDPEAPTTPNAFGTQNCVRTVL